MQEETPLAPAQIITSVILEPQYSLHSAWDTMGRAACCSLSGVLRAAGIEGIESGSLGPPAYWIYHLGSFQAPAGRAAVRFHHRQGLALVAMGKGCVRFLSRERGFHPAGVLRDP